MEYDTMMDSTDEDFHFGVFVQITSLPVKRNRFFLRKYFHQ